MLVLPAVSLAHKYKMLFHTIWPIVLPLVNEVHHPTQSALFHLYFAVLRLVSDTLSVIVTALFLHVVLLLFALTDGWVVSLIVDIVLDTVLALPAVSVASHAETYDVTVHCPDGVTVHLYTVLLTAVKLLMLALVTLTSQPVKFVVASLKVQVTMKLAPEK